MTSSQRTSFVSEITGDEELSEGISAYFEEHLINRIHSEFLRVFMELESNQKFTRSQLAKRTGKDRSQISRLIGAPGNWTFATVARLFLAMGYKLHIRAIPAVEEPYSIHNDSTSTSIAAITTSSTIASQETINGSQETETCKYREESETPARYWYDRAAVG